MKTINLVAGEHTIGNTSAFNIDILDSTDGNIQVYKTYNNGWKSWSHTETDPAFQGFNELTSGKGYYIKNDQPTEVSLPEVDVSFEGLFQENTGTNFIAAPRTETIEKDKYWTANSMKTMADGQWKSWSHTETDPAFQGFNEFEVGKGYVVDIATLKYSPSSYIPYGISLGLASSFTETVGEANYIDDALKLVISNRRQQF
ncbi:MAG: hypothetical protein U9R03_04445 [Candidatus Aerophobetes bacterium]|nr:hypothetical protein [Candidatus Aerophobetes bacterium]